MSIYPGVRFFHASDMIETVLRTRNIWLAGRLGSGKTLLAVALAAEFHRMGVCKYVYSNFPIRTDVFPPPPNRLLHSTFIICDEAHEWLNARDFMSNAREYGAYARKIDSIWLYPSVDTIDKRLRPVRIQRQFRLEALPWPAWVYRWTLSLGDEQDGGWFILFNPAACYGYYDHRFIPELDSGIMSMWKRTMEQAKKIQGGGWSPYNPGEWGGNGARR